MVVIINYGLSNVQSVFSKLSRLESKTKIGTTSQDVLSATKIILPGVGSFGEGMKNLKKLDLIGPLTEVVLERKVPILGICLGMQFFTEFSEEGDCEGLGWIKGKTRKFIFTDKKYPVPHVGWNTLQLQAESNFYQDISTNSRFYFTHSYFVSCDQKSDIGAFSEYGGQRFVSSICTNNIYGCQFHPEKSHFSGKKLIQNFLENI